MRMKKLLILSTVFVILLSILCTLPTYAEDAESVILGDMNGNGLVNIDDAIYLLRHVMMPEKYPISQLGDTNGDDKINIDDAIYLLRHVMMPGKYLLNCEEHVPVTDAAVAPNCIETGLAEGSHCSRCGLVFIAQEIIPISGEHIATVMKGVEPTCSKDGLTDGECCSACYITLKEQSLLPKLGHSFQDNKCLNCGCAAVDYTDVSLYAGSYLYEYLGTLDYGDLFQKFYKKIDEAVIKFHQNATANASRDGNGNYIVAYVNFSSLQITESEAEMIYRFYQREHPIFYWLQQSCLTNTSSICITTTNDYACGADRARLNALVYAELEEILSLTEGESSAYQLALTYHDEISRRYRYSTEAVNDNIPNPWAHSIIGAIEKGHFVCDGYANYFQVLLNFSGVENMIIGGSGHAWSIAKMDDGNWYWFDLTWDDGVSGTPQGFMHKFFCVNDTQMTNWRDATKVGGSIYNGSKNFMSEHTPNTTSYVVPTRSTQKFSNPDVLELRETFTVNGCTYALIGYDCIQLVSATKRTRLDIPEYVAYDGRVYKVISIGAMDANGFFDANESVIFEAEIVTVPSSVVYVWGNALNDPSLGEVIYEDRSKITFS